MIPELMDRPAADRDELAASLAFIRMVNCRLGGTAALLDYLKMNAATWPRDRQRPVRLLDVGTGSADIPLAVARWAGDAGHDVRITAIDLHPTTLDLAREHIGDRADIELVQLDALKLTERFQPGQFDYAHAGMFLHHLTDIEVMTVLRMMQRLATRAVIWNDLLRNIVGRIGVRLLMMRRGTPAMARHDGIVSVAKGFTRSEARALAQRAGLPNVRLRTHLRHRFTLISESAPDRHGA